MVTFTVGFLLDSQPVKVISVQAFNGYGAFVKAEELYKVNGWKFKYNDMYTLMRG